jgi:hypothetical protein
MPLRSAACATLAETAPPKSLKNMGLHEFLLRPIFLSGRVITIGIGLTH